MNPITRFRTRIRLGRLKTRLAAVLKEDQEARIGATTRDLVIDMVTRAGQIVALRQEIAELEGSPEDSGGMDSGGFDDRLPSGVWCPVKPKD